jgi:hypothetical protein
MPSFTDISSIPLDKFQMQKNPTSKQDPTNNQFFFYFDCPAQGYPVKFNPMIFDSTGKPFNILNYAVTSTINDKPYPMLYFASNGKFQMADVQSFIPVGIQITQKIHDTNIMGTSTSNDLQMIIECNQVSGSKIVFIHILLTNDTQNKKNGEDFNKLFDNLDDIEDINQNGNPKNFETLNLKLTAFKYNFVSGISNQFGLDNTDPIKDSMKCFYYLDTNKNSHILLQTPIPIDSNKFTKLQEFYTKVGLAVNPFTIYSNTNLTPDKSVPITNDVLLGTMDNLKNAQTNAPQTSDGVKASEKEKRNKDKQDKAVETAKKNSEGFIGSFFKEKEGLKTMNCRVAQSSDKLTTTIVGEKMDASDKINGFHLLFTILSILVIVIVVYKIIERNFLPTEPSKINSIKKIYDTFFQMNKWWNQVIPGLLLLASILLCIPMMIPGISSSVTFSCTVSGLVCFIVLFTIKCSIMFLNQRISPNRYAFADKLINSEKFKQYKLQEVDVNGEMNDREYKEFEEKYIIFLNQCMSYYFGDNYWYENKKNKKDVNTINIIQYAMDEDGKVKADEEIEVLINGGQEPYTYKKNSTTHRWDEIKTKKP